MFMTNTFATDITTILWTLNRMLFAITLDAAVPHAYHYYYCLFVDHGITIIIEHADAVRKISRNQLLQWQPSSPPPHAFPTPCIECNIINNNNTMNQISIHAQQSHLMVCAPEQCGDRVNLVSITFNPFSLLYTPLCSYFTCAKHNVLL